jgi:hypothetical protein
LASGLYSCYNEIMTDITTHLRSWGLNVDDSRIVSGRPGTFAPRGVLCHHTASNKSSGNFGSLGVVTSGRSDLPGPLCQFLLGRDGTVKIISLGRANHAGFGGPYNNIPKDEGNSYLWGIEAENDGIGESWLTEQYQAYVTLCAALTAYSKFSVANVFGHKEWTTRKIDPAGIDMDAFRRAVTARIKKGLPKNIIHTSKLVKGKSSPEVVRVKRRLKKLGYFKGISFSPFYGKNLLQAYSEYQHSLGYKGKEANGEVGDASLRKLGFIPVP